MTDTATLAPTTTKVAMAGIGYAAAPERLQTLLGSCVGVALWDPLTRQGALAHVVLPECRGNTKLPGKFADTAIEEMHRELVHRAANPLQMVAKIAGGATMFGPRTTRDIGQRNLEMVRQELCRLKIPLKGEHVGGEKGRVICIDTSNFTIEVFIGRDLAIEF